MKANLTVINFVVYFCYRVNGTVLTVNERLELLRS